MTLRNHPVRELLDAAAHGQEPTGQELDALVAGLCGGMGDDDRRQWRRRLHTAARAAVIAREEGEHADARRIAKTHAADLADQLAADWEPPTPEGPDAEAVADLVHRRF
jgi:hypothetical protein